MLFLLLGALGLWIVLAAMKALARANPQSLARIIKRAGGFIILTAAFGSLMLGRFSLAIALGAFGFWLIGFNVSSAWPTPLFQSVGRGRAAGKRSRVRSATVEMDLNHETGEMQGRIFTGPDQGKRLDTLSWQQCEALYKACLSNDPDGARLLEAYLDRRFSGWRAAEERNGDPGSSDGDVGRRPGTVSENQAYQVLGLEKGATREAIINAHHALMKKLHPDLGGSTDLAARVNEAKDVLMRRHL